MRLFLFTKDAPEYKSFLDQGIAIIADMFYIGGHRYRLCLFNNHIVRVFIDSQTLFVGHFVDVEECSNDKLFASLVREVLTHTEFSIAQEAINSKLGQYGLFMDTKITVSKLEHDSNLSKIVKELQKSIETAAVENASAKKKYEDLRKAYEVLVRKEESNILDQLVLNFVKE
jgi:hypothetical protein